MLPRSLLIAAIAVSVLVVWSVGFNPLTVWNLLPLIPVYSSAMNALESSDDVTALSPQRIAFCVTVLVLMAVMHLIWLFDWRDTKTGSSTSALVLAFAPPYIAALAGVLALLIMGGLALRRRLSHRA